MSKTEEFKFDAEFVASAIKAPKEKKWGLDQAFKKLKRASIKSQNALISQSCPPSLKKFEDTTTSFSIKLSSGMMYHVVAVHGKAGISFPADVTVRYQGAMEQQIEVNFQTRPWVQHQNNWRFKNIGVFAEEASSSSFVETMKAMSEEVEVILPNGFTVKNKGRNVMDIINKSVYSRHLKALRPKKKTK